MAEPAFSGPVELRPARTEADLADVRALCWEYRAHLLTLGPRDEEIVLTYYAEDVYEKALAELTTAYAPPAGETLLALRDGVPLACGMFHTVQPGAAEIKRVYVRPEAQSAGIGRQMMLGLIDRARALGFERILMDTGLKQEAARALYLRLGFQERGPYYQVPEIAEGYLYFFEMDLKG